MRFNQQDYTIKKCVLCKMAFKPNHPRLLRCRSCWKKGCSDCGRQIKTKLSRQRTQARKCARCYPLAIGSKRNESLGYIRIKTKSGWHLEHRVIAEKMIGRQLRAGEVVHHKDGNPSNNKPENLVVCRTNREHLDRFHKDDLKNPPLHHNGRLKKGSPGWKPVVKV